MRKSVTLTGALYSMSQFSIKLDKTSPINCISQHTKTLNSGYGRHTKSKLFDTEETLSLMKCKNKEELSELLALLFFYLGDIHRGTKMYDLSSE